MSFRLRTGNTGGSTGAHLHFGVWDPKTGTYIDPAPYQGFVAAGGKELGQWQVTSPFGDRVHPIHGTVRPHRGKDFATPEGTEITVPGGTPLRAWWDDGGGGNVASVGIKDPKSGNPLELRFMHLKELPRDFGTKGAGTKGAGTKGTGPSAAGGSAAGGSFDGTGSPDDAPPSLPQLTTPTAPPPMAPLPQMPAIQPQVPMATMAGYASPQGLGGSAMAINGQRRPSLTELMGLSRPSTRRSPMEPPPMDSLTSLMQLMAS